MFPFHACPEWQFLSSHREPWLFILQLLEYTLSFAFLPYLSFLRTSNVQKNLKNRTVITPKTFTQTYWLVTQREIIICACVCSDFVWETFEGRLQTAWHPLAWTSQDHHGLYRTRPASSLWNLKHWQAKLPSILSQFRRPWSSGK